MEPPSAKKKRVEKQIVMSHETVLMLCNLVEARSCLWNRKDPNIKCKNKQLDAWNEISTILNIPTVDLEWKWKSLCGSYRFYHGKVVQSKLTGSSAAAIYKPHWFAYDAMSFMSHVKEATPTIDTLGKNLSTTTSTFRAIVDTTIATEQPVESANPDPFISQPLEPKSSVLQPEVQPATSQTNHSQSPTAPLSIPQQPDLHESEPQTSERPSRFHQQNRRTAAETWNARTRVISEFMQNDAELIQLLQTLTNQTSAISDPESIEIAATFMQMIKQVPAERRNNLFGKVQEVFANAYNLDEDVIVYSRAISNLLQVMDSGKRKKVFKKIVREITNQLEDSDSE